VLAKPNMAGSWPATMYTPAPAVKPCSTGMDTKRVTEPSRRDPTAIWMTPVSTVMASITATGSPPPASRPRLAASMTEMALVGPSIRKLDEPKAAPSTLATMAAYRPCTGGTPATRA
jgi:hypothetical protein